MWSIPEQIPRSIEESHRVGWAWAIEGRGELRSVRVMFSKPAFTSEFCGPDVAEGKRSKGRSFLVAYLDRWDPPATLVALVSTSRNGHLTEE